jgi:SAM-dependent methyltransferase
MGLGTLLNKSPLCPRLSPADIFPSIEKEFGTHRNLFQGRVLNAGAGDRDISFLIDGELFNQDIPHGLHNANIHIYSPLHEIPKPDQFFDVIICNAVLEHVANPEQIMEEFGRVIKDGGILYLGLPFLQPEHKDPTDFQRYTADGLAGLAQRHGFSVDKIESIHNVYITFSWIVVYWLSQKDSVRNFFLKLLLYPILGLLCRTSNEHVFAAASCYRLIGARNSRVNDSTDLIIDQAN